MNQKKFSKDPKIELVSIEEFLNRTDYLKDAKNNLWGSNKPDEFTCYYKFTPQYLLLICYGMTTINFGMDTKEILDKIIVAQRDGKTEYELFNIRKQQLLNKRSEYKKNKKLDNEIENINKIILSLKKLFPPYNYSHSMNKIKKFDDYIIDVGYKTKNVIKGIKYIVFDIETNGIRKSNDDLLSISIYDPSTGICYNRFLPLEMQPLVLTSYIHGIVDEDLINATHITQEELDEIIERFDLKNSVLLSYSGGKGTFDRDFVINYCKRHNISGFEQLKFDNIKRYIPQAGFGMEGELTKDNFCRLLNIDGVTDIHSGLNDCILEWKLFEKVINDKLFFIQEHLYRYHSEYIIPITYISLHPELKRLSGVQLPQLIGIPTKIYEYELPYNVLNQIKKFSTNITGIALENAITSLLNAKVQDNQDFLISNKSYLEYVGSLYSRLDKISINTEDDGTIRSLNDINYELVNEVNNVTKVIMENINPLIMFIKNDIFDNESEIISQELVISEDKKILALCDLSSKKSVLEIKTFNVLNENGNIGVNLSRQLYYQKNNRRLYVLSIVFIKDQNAGLYNDIINNVKFIIYRVELDNWKPEPIMTKLCDSDYKILKHIINNPIILNKDLAKLERTTLKSIGNAIKRLQQLGFIHKEDRKRNTPWTILKVNPTYTYIPICLD